MSLVSTKWLFNNRENVKIVDCSWHLPNEKRNSLEEYNSEHIPNAIYFDIDKNSDQNSDLPHMLPSKKQWEETVSSLGISNDDKLIIYDNYDQREYSLMFDELHKLNTLKSDKTCLL